MKLLLLILPLLMLGGCVDSGIYDTPGEVTIPVTISEQGISVEVSDIQINNFRAAASVTAVYAITNNTDGIVTPDIYINTNITPSDYDKAADYELCPESALSWLNIPAIPDIRPGESITIPVIFKSPGKITGDIPKKYTFRTGIASGKGGLFQTAVETWWLVDMR